MEFVIYFSKLERCEVIIKARPTRVIRYLAIVALCLLLGFMLGRKSKYEKRDYLKQFKIGKATYSESLIYEAYGGLQNDGIMLAVYYDVDAAKIIHQLDSWEKINDSPTMTVAFSIRKERPLSIALPFPTTWMVSKVCYKQSKTVLKNQTK